MDRNFLKVSDVMQTSIHMISGLATVREAIAQMKAKGVSALVIERRHNGDEYGFLSLDEIAARVIALNRSLDRTSVYEVMDKPTLTLNPHMATKYAIRLLSRLQQRRALVVDEGGAKGIVTMRDLVLAQAEHKDADLGPEDGIG